MASDVLDGSAQDLSRDLRADSPNQINCADIGHITDLQQRTFAGGGVQVWLQLEGSDNAPIDAGSVGDCVAITPQDDDEEVVWEVGRRDFHGGHTLILAVPGLTEEENDEVVAAVDGLIGRLPDGEQVAIYRWSDQVLQVASFTDRIDTLATRVESAIIHSEASLLPLSAAFDAATDELRDISREAAPTLRTLVVIAPSLEVTEVPDGPGHLINLWLVATDSTGSLAEEPRTFVAEVGREEGLADHLEDFTSIISDYRDAGAAVVGACPSRNGMDIEITAHESDANNTVGLDDPRPEQDTNACDPNALLEEDYDATRRVEFIFTQEQRAIYNQRIDDLDTADFSVFVRPSPRHGQTGSEAHIRGKGSLACQRKSLAVDLGSRARFLLPDSATDEYLLISMCKDAGYVNQLTANRLMRDLGHFELQSELVELVIDEATAGVYLLLENPANEFVLDHARPRAVLRRDLDIDNRRPDVKFSINGDAWALERYEGFVESLENYSGEALKERLLNRMDFVQYMRWVALMSLLRNGDYVDEVWFTASEMITNDAPDDYYTITGWDTDDLFSDCHHSGRFAFDDPNRLLYCAESILDHTVFADPLIYAWYVDILEETINRVTQEVFDASVDQTVAGLLPFFEDQDVRDAMVELLETTPGATDAEVARDAIVTSGEALKDEFSARRSDYTQRVQDYRDSQ